MSFSKEIKESVLVACRRSCSICHKPCSTNIELHHIIQKSDGGEDSFENCIPLCFDCHADVKAYNSHHPKGTKFTESELKRHRDNWYKQVSMGIVQSNGFFNASTPQYNESDKILYLKIKEIFSKNNCIEFVQINNFAGFSFDTRIFSPFHEFEHKCEYTLDFSFIDSELEQQKLKLFLSIQKFTSIIASETFPAQTMYYNSVPSEWEYEQPDRFNRVVNNIHNTAKSIINNYKIFLQIGRTKFSV